MPGTTDPARELVDLFERIGQTSNVGGAEYLGSLIGASPWTVEFHQFVGVIIERIALLRSVVRSIDIDDDILASTMSNLAGLQSAFDGTCLTHPWSSAGGTRLSVTNITAIKSLVPSVRAKLSYPRLTATEIAEVLELARTLETWLSEHQISEQDFIRQAILEGLRQFIFRMSHLEWLGWGYTVQSLRDVIGAYLALERGVDLPTSPDADAVLKKVAAFVRRSSEIMNTARDTVDNVKLIVQAYGTYSLISAGKTTISGFLTASS